MAKHSHISQPTYWRNRPAWLISNGLIDLVALSGGGHLADLRFCPASGYPVVNALWEAPWETVDPQRFKAKDVVKYGVPFVGKFLSGFTGHALCLDYFGAPSDDEIKHGLALHGEAPVSEWQFKKAPRGFECAVDLPNAGLKFNRSVSVLPGESVIYIREMVQNQRSTDRHFCWVEHATFGPPFLSAGESGVFISGEHGRTWSYGYEGKGGLRDNSDFTWPNAPRVRAGRIDLRKPFAMDHKGFVATVRVSQEAGFGYVAVLNWRIGLAAGYLFPTRDFPWITLWEENRARNSVPWAGVTQARGVEFGTTPFPIGMREIIQQGPLFETPTLSVVGAKCSKLTSYAMFLTPVTRDWREIRSVSVEKNRIVLHSEQSRQKISILASGIKAVVSA